MLFLFSEHPDARKIHADAFVGGREKDFGFFYNGKRIVLVAPHSIDGICVINMDSMPGKEWREAATNLAKWVRGAFPEVLL